MKRKGEKVLRKLVALISGVVLLTLVAGCQQDTNGAFTPASTDDQPTTVVTPVIAPTTKSTGMPIVRISQVLIDEGVDDCKDKAMWGISFGIVRTNYVVGVALEAAIILHNGGNVVRLVTLECSPMFVTNVASVGTLGGTITFTKDSSIVTGLGGHFTSELVNGDYDYISVSENARWYQVVSRDSNTSVTISPAFAEETVTGSRDSSVRGIGYQPSPTASCLWLKPDIRSIRLQPNETKVIKVTLAVPATVVNLPKYWEIDLKAEGTPINTYTQEVFAKSVDIRDPNTGQMVPDTVVTFHLTQPLLEGIESILSITSSISETPNALNWNEETGILTLGGFKSNAERTILITYEYQPAMTIAYNQIWLVTMME